MLKTLRPVGAALLAAALMTLGWTGSAAAQDEFEKFEFCPSTTLGVFKCVHSITNSGEVVLGSKAVPIVNPVTLQGGISKANEAFTSEFFGATNGDTLSKTPQPVPGGLAGLVPPDDLPPLVREAWELVFENGFTGVNATLELARPASEIEISEFRLAAEEGVALKLPVKVHLENPLLGSNCYVGSSSSPLIWNLTTEEPGDAGTVELKEEGRIVVINNNKLVDNSWSAPVAEGCGGIFSLVIDPIVNLQAGLPAAAGVNSAILNNTISVARASVVNQH